MNVTVPPGAVVLTIDDVQLQDEMEFVCIIRSLTEGAAEGRTKLKVFGKRQKETIRCQSLSESFLLLIIP